MPGDICILAEPSPGEIAEIRQRQRALQTLFGGRLHERVHLTCQRFALPDESILPQIIECLDARLATLPPFPLTSVSLVAVDAPFWQTRLLRWQIEVTEDLRNLSAQIRKGLAAINVTPHFRTASSRLVTALEDVSAFNPVCESKDVTFPQYLFTVHQIVLSKILAPREFEILATIQIYKPKTSNLKLTT